MDVDATAVEDDRCGRSDASGSGASAATDVDVLADVDNGRRCCGRKRVENANDDESVDDDDAASRKMPQTR